MQKTLGRSAGSEDNSGAIDGADYTIESPLTTDADEARDMMAAADSIPGKAPAFQFYPNDFLSDANVIVQSMQERGVYITLICVCWQQGSLPTAPEQLARFCGLPLPIFRKLWPAVAPCFRATGERFVHPRLDRERKKQREFRKLQSDKGKASAASRRKSTTVQPRLDSGSTERQPAHVQSVQPKPNSSIFGLQSSSSSAERKSAPTARPSLSPSSDSTLSDRAGNFIERYQALYSKHRKGAHYHHRPIDFQHALELCRTWVDDARLDKIAVVFLTTDHKFAEEGSRTLGQLAAMASWCDGRLAEAGIA